MADAGKPPPSEILDRLPVIDATPPDEERPALGE
jgi:hypothetical protein